MYDYDSDEYRVTGEAPQMDPRDPRHPANAMASAMAVINGDPRPLRRMPVKTRRVDLDGDFAGWWAKVRTNAPFGLFLKLTNMGGDFGDDGTRAANAMAELLALLPQLVSEWNFVDTEGQPLPCDATGMQQLPMDLINALFGAISAGETVPKA